jgi:hypothetical protein
MDAPKWTKSTWGGRLWLLAAIAIVLAILVVVVLMPRPLAYIAPVPTAVPWTAAPGLYSIPTVVVPTPAP